MFLNSKEEFVFKNCILLLESFFFSRVNDSIDLTHSHFVLLIHIPQMLDELRFSIYTDI